MMEQLVHALLFALSVLGGLVILTILVVIHELGHAIVARRNGVVVEEFGIGFPPLAKSWRLRSGIKLSLNWLPLGGFVRLKGEHDNDKGEGAYGAASLWRKAKILLAGVATNWVAAAILLTIVSLFGIPKLVPDQFIVPADSHTVTSPVTVVKVVSGSPAEKSGLQVGDEVVKFAGQTVATEKNLATFSKANAGKTVDIIYRHGSSEVHKSVTLNTPEKAHDGYLGAAAGQDTTYRSTWSAPIVGVGLTAQLSYETIKGVGVLLGQVGQGVASKFSANPSVQHAGQDALGQANQAVSGPVGILFMLFPSFEKAGIIPLLFLSAVISLTLAVMNILPIPALDGGRLMLTLIFRALKKPLTKELEERIVGYSFYGLILLVVFISVLDVGKLFQR